MGLLPSSLAATGQAWVPQAEPCIEPALLVTQPGPGWCPARVPRGRHTVRHPLTWARGTQPTSQHLTEGRQDTWDRTRLRNVFPLGFVVKIHIFF